MLRDRYRVIVQAGWHGERADAVIALHAGRSHDAIAAASAAGVPVGLVLTGTDLYRDLDAGSDVRRSLALADRIVALQDEAPRLLDARSRRKCEVIFQSARGLRPAAKARGWLDCVAVGHLRAEKDPATLFEAMAHLPRELPIHLRHVGAVLDPVLGAAARALQADDARFRYVGALPHGLARSAIKSAHLLVHPSRVEGGANVIAEAVSAGTPVVASRVAGNVGMLGRGYSGYFEPGDASGLARLLVRVLQERGYLELLRRECATLRARFAPAAEARSVRRLVAALLALGTAVESR